MGLREAYELIRDKRRWTSGRSACDKYGNSVGFDEPTAVRWCASGAYALCGYDDETWLYMNRLSMEMFQGKGVIDVNDGLGHAAVIQIFEKALIEREGSL